ncbi:MAG: SUMF1/EgtB/PvdO family nonheme iron enzyme [Gemmatimonadetes bacterium]|nr:SUMF1/EgtB/PvdO family nonheme iron enzyme [Gemmatimonadota bacterium]NNM32169.1 SUMF1/EgtB/PvdO family nonheme iron enzyme [Gemmatimonadota bacterium]
MRLVPGAEFRMGTDSVEFDGIVQRTGLQDAGPLGPEFPAHFVRVDLFFMDTVDVTNAAFAEFVRARPEWGASGVDPATHNGRYLEHWSEGTPPEELREHPVTFVTWASARAYCEWRGKRLPTEAEYEWAAQSPEGGEYPWGDAAPHDSLVSWGGNGLDRTMPVAWELGSQRRESSRAVSGQSSAVRCAGDGGFPVRHVG